MSERRASPRYFASVDAPTKKLIREAISKAVDEERKKWLIRLKREIQYAPSFGGDVKRTVQKLIDEVQVLLDGGS